MKLSKLQELIQENQCTILNGRIEYETNETISISHKNIHIRIIHQ